MNDMRAIADRVEIEALRGELTDAVMMRDYDRVESLFTPECVVRWPHIGREFAGREAIRAGVEWGAGPVGVLRSERPPGRHQDRR
ncbi:nuclear transport factor 2 family protein [Nonomuraea salmonea]|uniref:nuclear transport factor 2 family protein n=1 Tax=Nonomuraea salmonea TaxID=46181 RepID=UPI0031EA741A